MLNKLAQCCLVYCPHSMITERAVKINRKATTARGSEFLSVLSAPYPRAYARREPPALSLIF